MPLRLFTLASANSMLTAMGVSTADADSRGINNVQGVGNQSTFVHGETSKMHINQNGNGCRAHCYNSDTTINGGWNNGNTVAVDDTINNTANFIGNRLGHFKKGKAFGAWKSAGASPVKPYEREAATPRPFSIRRTRTSPDRREPQPSRRSPATVAARLIPTPIS